MILKASRILLITCTCLMSTVYSAPKDSEDYPLELACALPNDVLIPNSLAYLREGFEALEPILPNICNHLNIQDRCNLRQVCSMFKNAVDLANFQAGPDLQVIQIEETDNNQNPAQPGKSIFQIIKVKPKLSLLFFNDEKPPGMSFSSDALMVHYIPQLPKSTPIVCIEGMSTILDHKNIQAGTNNAVGLFFPENDRKARILTSAIGDYYLSGNEFDSALPRSFLSGLQSTDTAISRTKNPMGLIMFHLQIEDDDENEDMFMYNKYGRWIVKELQKGYIRKFGSGGLAIWGSNVRWLSSVGLNLDPQLPTTSFAMRIAGPLVSSWSLVIDSIARKQDIKKKVLDFARSIRYNPERAIALSLQTTDSKENSASRVSKEKIFSSAFPGLRLFSFGIERGLPKYCIDSTSVAMAYRIPQIKYSENYICYLVISY